MKSKKYVEKIAKKYGLQLLLLFGSRAEGTEHKSSDFDIAYYSKRELTLREEASLMVELMPVVRSENLDLVNLKKASPLLYYAVFKSPKILYAKDMMLFYNLEGYAFKRFVEAGPLLEIRSHYLKKIFSNQ